MAKADSENRGKKEEREFRNPQVQHVAIIFKN